MEPHVFAAVLAAAALHAGWNALLKGRLDPLLGVTLVAGGCSAVGLPLLLAVGWPAAAAWPWLLGSLVLHLGYFVTLSGAYRRADMSQVYPIARGGAPLLTAVAASWWLHEGVSAVQFAGIAALGLSVVALSAVGRRRGTRFDPVAVTLALATAAIISGYTLLDGLGARAAGDPHAYTAALFVLDGIPVVLFTLWRRGSAAIGPLRARWLGGLAGGAMSFAAYWTVIWAMTVAPIPLVAALREASVLFASVIAVAVLKEPLQWSRALAGATVVASLALIRLG